MSAYLIVDLDIKNPEAFAEYRRDVGATIAQYGGKPIVRNGPFEVFEGNWKPKSVVVLEFPSMDAIKRWYNSPEYKPLIAKRQSASAANMIAVEGL
ncbi:MAG: DUF1330 domain-containing protein [Candidatus Binataceae bacterium]|nr:DUF1330 domain-containing protein [Candidatus Binataceae bacterium]